LPGFSGPHAGLFEQLKEGGDSWATRGDQLVDLGFLRDEGQFGDALVDRFVPLAADHLQECGVGVAGIGFSTGTPGLFGCPRKLRRVMCTCVHLSKPRATYLFKAETPFFGVYMKVTEFLCSVCKRRGKEIRMIEEHDMLICPECKTSFFIKGKSPLGRYEESWRKNAEELFPLLRPPFYQDELANPRLFFLYDDCYHTLLIGKYNASIVLMGVLLEVIMKERIRLKLGINLRKAYGPCLRKIEKERLMEPKDIRFLKRFKDEIRNPYQHADELQILKELVVPVWPLQYKGNLSPEKMEKTMKMIRSGHLKPKLVMAADVPVPGIRSVVKQAYDRQHAIDLFNQVYDFLRSAKIKYFKEEEYQEYRKKFGSQHKDLEPYRI